jgi:uncharacterized SAM-binding protein YcdF (DUF218 family)
MKRANGRPRGRFRFGILVGALLAFALVGALNWQPVVERLSMPLLRPNTTGDAQAIVVLGGGIDRKCSPGFAVLRRTLLGVRLYKHRRAPLLAFSGGMDGSSCPEATIMASIAHDMGVPEGAMALEKSSGNTWENATMTSRMLLPRGIRKILLVTDAVHMRRAEACFRSVGFEVGRVSVPIFRRARFNPDLLLEVVHEYLGWWYYRYKGYIKPEYAD